MKKRGILHPDLSRIIASLGHGDMVVIADAGLPVPAEVHRIDLAFSTGKPAFQDVLTVVLDEMQVEAAVLAHELREVTPPPFHQAVLRALPVDERQIQYLSHNEFKILTMQAKVVIRTGEFTPYANIILTSGVNF